MKSKDKQEIIKKLDLIFSRERGVSNYAFSLYLFVEKLYKKSKEDGVTDLFFLARDGKFLKELFDCFLEYKKTSSPLTHYMFVSRSSIINATLKELDEERFEWVKSYNEVSKSKFLHALQFNSEEIKMLDNDLEKNESFNNFLQSDGFYALKSDETFRDMYEHKRKQNYSNFLKYLENSGFYSAYKVAVVDLGWNGTIQDNINKVCNSREIIGYYLGCFSQEKAKDNVKIGLMFQGDEWSNPVRVCNYYYEYICAADHGSTYSYDKLGTPLLTNGDEVSLYEKYYKKIQHDIKRKFIAIMQEVGDNHYEWFEYYVMSRHARMLTTLTCADRKMIADTIKVWGDLIDAKPSRKVMKIIKIILYKIKIYMTLKYDQHTYDKKLTNSYNN